MLCPYCNNDAKLVYGMKIYPHRPDLFYKHFWECEPCKAYVGCHSGTEIPLGTLANAFLRQKRSHAHLAFDTLWKDKHFKSRTAAYQWLASKMGLPSNKCHIAMFDKEQCNEVLDAVTDYWQDKLSNKDTARVE